MKLESQKSRGTPGVPRAYEERRANKKQLTDGSGHGVPITAAVVDAILEIGRERNEILAHLRMALESGNEADALQWARQLCGLSPRRDQEGAA